MMASRSSTMTNLQSVIRLATQAVVSSEAAMEASRLANIQAKYALDAAKSVLLQGDVSVRRQGESTDTVKCSEIEPSIDDENSDGVFDQIDTLDSQSELVRERDTRLCIYCNQESCQGKVLTHFRESYIGKKVRLVGSKWTEDMKRRVGLVEGFQEGQLLLKWSSRGAVKKFWLILERNKAAEFQFEFCCDLDPVFLQEFYSGSDGSLDEDPVNLPIRRFSNCCKDTQCPGGQFVTHFEKSFTGLRVKYCGGDMGNGDAWLQKRKQMVWIVDGYEDGHIKLRRENKVKKFHLIYPRDSTGGEFNFKFSCQEEENPAVQGPNAVLSSNCGKQKFVVTQNSEKLQGKRRRYTEEKFVTHYSEKIKGRRVQYCGETGVGRNWSEEKRKRVGVIQGFDKGYLHIKWQGEENVKKFVLILHRESGPEYQFKFHGKEKEEFSNSSMAIEFNSIEEIIRDEKTQREKDDVESNADEDFDVILLSDPGAEIVDIENDQTMIGEIENISDDDNDDLIIHYSPDRTINYSREFLFSLQKVPLSMKEPNNFTNRDPNIVLSCLISRKKKKKLALDDPDSLTNQKLENEDDSEGALIQLLEEEVPNNNADDDSLSKDEDEDQTEEAL